MKLYTFALHIHEIMSLVMILISIIIGTYLLGQNNGRSEK